MSKSIFVHRKNVIQIEVKRKQNMAQAMFNEMNIKFNQMKKKISTMNKIEIERKNGTKIEYKYKYVY